MQDALKAGVQVIAARNFSRHRPRWPSAWSRRRHSAGHSILEPSAGTGAILAALPNVRPFGSVTAVEINAKLAASLEQVADETIVEIFWSKTAILVSLTAF